MKKLLFFVLLAVLTACNKNAIEVDNFDLDARLKGVWKITGFRLAGMNIIDELPMSYVILDPENGQAALMSGEIDRKDSAPICEIVELKGDKSLLTLGGLECPYEFFIGQDEEILMLHPKATAFIGERANFEGGVQAINMQLYRDRETESKMGEFELTETKGFWDVFEWVGKGICAVTTYVYKKVVSNVIDPYIPAVNYEPWSNTDGWNLKNWMSKLPGDMRVCSVNIPGSHDSCTGSINLIGDAVSADCQTYSIMEQYDKGARYFDLRIGNEFVWDKFPQTKRLPNESEIAATKDLYLYHGNFRSDEMYKQTLKGLAEKIRKDKKEFLVINMQWEDLSYGLLDKAALWLNDKVDKTDNDAYFTKNLKHITLDIANRLERELNSEYDNDLFICYTPDLTVDQARGHIILMQDVHNDDCAKKNPHCSYLKGWPNDACGYAKIFPIAKKDEVSDNLYVQSIYEMKLSDYDLIDNKKNEMKKAAGLVALANELGNWTLGFNATNANGGKSGCYDLDSYEFAHIFNGYAFDMFVENMKSKSDIPFHGGIIAMDHFGATRYYSKFRSYIPVSVYGEYLAWAVIESNFYRK